jgi:hypothetical protein
MVRISALEGNVDAAIKRRARRMAIRERRLNVCEVSKRGRDIMGEREEAGNNLFARFNPFRYAYSTGT